MSRAYLSRSPEKFVTQLITSIKTFFQGFGSEGLVFAMMIFGTIALIGTWNAAAGMVLTAFAVISIMALGIVPFGYATVSGLVVAIFILIWRTRG